MFGSTSTWGQQNNQQQQQQQQGQQGQQQGAGLFGGGGGGFGQNTGGKSLSALAMTNCGVWESWSGEDTAWDLIGLTSAID